MKIMQATTSNHSQFKNKQKGNDKGPKSQGRVHDNAKNSRM